LWNGERLPRSPTERLLRYADDFESHTQRIQEFERQRRKLLREERAHAPMAKVWRLLELKGVGIVTAWCYGTEFLAGARCEPQASGFAGGPDADPARQRQAGDRAWHRQGRTATGVLRRASRVRSIRSL